MKKSTISALLVMAQLAALTACGGSETPVDDTAAGDTTSAAPAETEVSDDIPELDFGGAPVRILTGDYNIYPTRVFDLEETGDVLDDALFARNRYLEERFNVKLEEVIAGDFINDIPGMVREVVLAGDNAYEMLMTVDRFALNLGMEGCLYSYGDLPYINLDKPYWNQNVKEDFSVDGKLFFSYGDDNLVFFGSTTILAFNKQMVADYKLDDPYQLVYDGKWTYDAYMEMNAAVTVDINGDNAMDINDQWGTIMAFNMFYPNFWLQDGLKLIEKDADDLPYFNVPGNEPLMSVLIRMAEAAQENVFYDVNVRTDYKDLLTASAGMHQQTYNDVMALFSMNKSLFASSSLLNIVDARSMETDFGILPFPATEEKEPGYVYGSRTFGGFPYSVPITVDNVEMVSAVMEASACYASKNIIPVMYDKVLKGKNTRDEDSANMLDMMRQNRITDLGECYWFDIEYAYEKACKDGNVNMASLTESLVGTAETQLEKAIEFFKALE